MNYDGTPAEVGEIDTSTAVTLDYGLSVSAIKRQYRAHRHDIRRAERRENRKQIRCWWTWPFRHEWAIQTIDQLKWKVCVGCGTKRRDHAH